jgi:hypothetical protein
MSESPDPLLDIKNCTGQNPLFAPNWGIVEILSQFLDEEIPC